MKLKKYTADSLRAALRLARIELGADATLVDSKESAAGDSPRFEATFAVGSGDAGRLGDNRMPDGRHWRSFVPPEIRASEASNVVELKPRPAVAADAGGSAAAPAQALEQVAAEISAALEDRRPEAESFEIGQPEPAVQIEAPSPPDPSLKAILIQLRALQSAVDSLRKSGRPESKEDSSQAAQAVEALEQAGVDLDTWPEVHELLEEEVRKGRSALELASWLRARMAAAWKVAPQLAGEDGPTLAALVGPGGAGKTSALLKLAVQQGLRRRRTAHLVLADPLRWGSAEALGAQAESAGALLTVARGPEDLVNRVDRIREEIPDDGLILIDTPGYAPSEKSRAQDLAAALEEVGGVEVHLTLNASVGEREVRRAVESSALFSPQKLLFTHLDLVSQPGLIWNESSRTGLPISFLGTGPKTPEDLRAANAGRLTNLLFSR